MALALAKEKFEDEYTLSHIGHCAARLDDLKQIKRELTTAGIVPLSFTRVAFYNPCVETTISVV
jgi:hypothetical protein